MVFTPGNVDFASHKAETAVCVTYRGAKLPGGDSLFSLRTNAHEKFFGGPRRRR